MRRDDVLATLREHRDELMQRGVLSLALFGSVARDEAGPDSDVDVLAELERPAGLFKYIAFKQYLEDLLGCRVDVITPGGLRPDVKANDMEDTIRVA
jgi:predicted nucleotidyltransferase